MALKAYRPSFRGVEKCLAHLAHADCWRAWFGEFPAELHFVAQTANGEPLKVIGLLTRPVASSKAMRTVANEPFFAVCQKTGRNAKSLYLVSIRGYAKECAELASAEMTSSFWKAFTASPYAAIHERHQRVFATSLAAYLKGNWANMGEVMDRHLVSNPFFEEAMREERVLDLDRKDAAQLRLAQAREIHFTHFEAGQGAKFDALMGPSVGRSAAVPSAQATPRIDEGELALFNQRLESNLRALAKA